MQYHLDLSGEEYDIAYVPLINLPNFILLIFNKL